MTEILCISLLPDQLPAPPADSDVRAGPDAVSHGSLPARQAAAANVLRRAQAACYLGALQCLRPRLSPHKAIGFSPWLLGDNTEEGA